MVQFFYAHCDINHFQLQCMYLVPSEADLRNRLRNELYTFEQQYNTSTTLCQQVGWFEVCVPRYKIPPGLIPTHHWRHWARWGAACWWPCGGTLSWPCSNSACFGLGSAASCWADWRLLTSGCSQRPASPARRGRVSPAMFITWAVKYD